MKIIDLTSIGGFSIKDLDLVIYYEDEVKWLNAIARRSLPDGKNTIAIGSYQVLVNKTKSFTVPHKVSQNHEEIAFVTNEYIRLRQEANEIDNLFDLAQSVATLRKDLCVEDLLGLKYEADTKDLKISTDSVLMIKNFQRANNSLLIKMKEISVRALLRGIQPPFIFDENFDVGNDKSVLTSHHNTQAHKRGTYKSLFDK